MYVKLKKDQVMPAWGINFIKKGYAEARVVATGPEVSGIKKWKFLENKKDVDNLPERCMIDILFEDGTHVQVPLETFRNTFSIIPEGDYTSALYCD